MLPSLAKLVHVHVRDLQHHQAAQPAEGVIWDVADVVEGERHGLQGGQLPQGLHRHLPQRVIVQPQVPQGAQAPKTASGNLGDVISIQAAADRKTKEQTEAWEWSSSGSGGEQRPG